MMKIRFDSSKERSPTQEQGLKVLYAPGKRVAFRLRWYLILFLVASPFVWFFAKLIYGAWVIEAPAQLILPVVEIRARDAARVEHLAVKDGDTVKAGQLLLQMDNPEWRQRLGQLQALTAGAERSVAPAGSGLRNVLVRQLDRAREKLATVQRLRQDGAATQGEALAAASERDQRESELLAFDQREESLRLQPPATRDNAMQKAEEVWLNGRLQALRLQAQENAVVSDVVVNEGENVGSGTVLMRLQRTADPMVLIFLDPVDAAYAKPGQPLKLQLPDGHWLPAKVVNAADRVRRLPEDLRMPFAGAQNALLVSAAVDGEVPPGWLVNQLPLKARFPHDLSRLWR
ncbi:biotin/lipoyl-binding protein [Cupriavidus basilensis]|uniref:Biotin/lipoyl-binding protein n=1 Tax=Cupriavidus basilensis TaxID=68895 RepID=A0ABT6B440_9BURK|nr:biotin/lipoyl-binding protein [Cupriavidus basilensis]MDF3839655.1 biotin/lipoyl-binding protein [Cupriavidus basilensis]